MTNKFAKRLFELFSSFFSVLTLLILLIAKTIRLTMVSPVFSIQERDLPF